MSRELKFRAWANENKEMLFWDVTAYFSDVEHGPLMQYTGLKDKNGVEIYEGDVLDEMWRCEVYEEQGCFMVRFHNNPKTNHPRTVRTFLDGRNTAKCATEVIGNIHENPELLTKEKTA